LPCSFCQKKEPHPKDYLLSAGEDKAVRVWDIETGKTVRFIRGEIGAGHEGKIYAMALSPDGRMVAVGGWLAGRVEERCAVRLHDTATGRVLGILKGHTNVILSLAFSLDGKYLASGQSGTSNPTVRIWDADKKKQMHVLEGHKNKISALAFSPDEKHLVSGSVDHTLILWGVRYGRQIATLAGHKDDVYSVAYDLRGRYIASGSWDNTIRLWDGMTGRFIKILADQGTGIGSLTFSPDGTKLLSGTSESSPHNCHVYSVPDGKELVTFREHDNIVFATAISPDGQLAATGGGNNKDILIWNLADGRIIKRLSGVGASVQAVGFSKNSSAIAWGQTSSYQSHNNWGSLKHTLFFRTNGDWNLVPGRDVKNESGFVRASDTHGYYRLKHEKGGD
ncbi:MAG: WD40 repeat domain-containing protein, partial [Desulfobacteraceae bacterium]|nr:WD40 repeat domain-containing protein [Desulfobacteraceae bacterium]